MISRPGIGRQTLKTDTAAPLHGPCMSGAMPLQKAGNTPDETPVSALVRMRLDAVARSERLTRAGVGQTKADAQAAAAAGVAAVSVTRWRLACRGLAPEARIAVLADRPGRGRCGPLTDSQMRDCVEALIYDHGPHLTATHVVRVLAARYGKAPGLRAVQRWLKAWRAKNARALSAVTDPDGHKNKYLPAFGSRSEGVDAPNALWELDSTPADVMCADGRHAIVGVIDIWPRRAKVLVVPVSRATALCALMRRCLIDWGVPERAKTDGGADYVSRHFTRVLADLGITHDICPPYTPEAKPHIERFFGTMTRDLFAYLPGFVGHDVADRKRIEARRSMAARRGQGERETFNVSLTAAELQQKCDLWCDAIYDRRAQTGLGGQSPWERRRSSNAPLRRITDERALDPLLAEPATHGGMRTVAKTRLSVDGGRYTAADLGHHIGARVGVRLDPCDAGRVYVFNADGSFLCMAEDELLLGRDRAEVAAKTKAAARHQKRETRERARQLKRDHKPERAMDDVLAAAAETARNVVALPRKGRGHEAPGLAAATEAASAARKGQARHEGPARATGTQGGTFMDALQKIHLNTE